MLAREIFIFKSDGDVRHPELLGGIDQHANESPAFPRTFFRGRSRASRGVYCSGLVGFCPSG